MFHECNDREEFFTEYHKDSFEKFYPAIGEKVKIRIDRLVRLGFTAIGTAITMPVSSVDDFNNKNLVGILNDKSGLKSSMKSKASAYITGIGYLCENGKDASISIEEYFTKFVKELLCRR